MLNPIALANTFAAIDLVLHPAIHIWSAVAPRSYESTMRLFVSGLEVRVTERDTNAWHVLRGTVTEAGTLWLLGFCAGHLYNRFARSGERA